jgi:transposase
MKAKKTERTPYNRYSVAFKMQVVEEVENGLISAEAARKLYNIPGKATIAEWIDKYGMNQRINKAVYIMTNDEEKELLSLRKEVQRLKKALDDSHLKNLALESLVELVEENYGDDVKKNFGPKLLEELKRKLMPSNSAPGSD